MDVMTLNGRVLVVEEGSQTLVAASRNCCCQDAGEECCIYFVWNREDCSNPLCADGTVIPPVEFSYSGRTGTESSSVGLGSRACFRMYSEGSGVPRFLNRSVIDDFGVVSEIRYASSADRRKYGLQDAAECTFVVDIKPYYLVFDISIQGRLPCDMQENEIGAVTKQLTFRVTSESYDMSVLVSTDDYSVNSGYLYWHSRTLVCKSSFMHKTGASSYVYSGPSSVELTTPTVLRNDPAANNSISYELISNSGPRTTCSTSDSSNATHEINGGFWFTVGHAYVGFTNVCDNSTTTGSSIDIVPGGCFVCDPESAHLTWDRKVSYDYLANARYETGCSEMDSVTYHQGTNPYAYLIGRYHYFRGGDQPEDYIEYLEYSPKTVKVYATFCAELCDSKYDELVKSRGAFYVEIEAESVLGYEGNEPIIGTLTTLETLEIESIDEDSKCITFKTKSGRGVQMCGVQGEWSGEAGESLGTMRIVGDTIVGVLEDDRLPQYLAYFENNGASTISGAYDDTGNPYGHASFHSKEVKTGFGVKVTSSSGCLPPGSVGGGQMRGVPKAGFETTCSSTPYYAIPSGDEEYTVTMCSCCGGPAAGADDPECFVPDGYIYVMGTMVDIAQYAADDQQAQNSLVTIEADYVDRNVPVAVVMTNKRPMCAVLPGTIGVDVYNQSVDYSRLSLEYDPGGDMFVGLLRTHIHGLSVALSQATYATGIAFESKNFSVSYGEDGCPSLSIRARYVCADVSVSAYVEFCDEQDTLNYIDEFPFELGYLSFSAVAGSGSGGLTGCSGATVSASCYSVVDGIMPLSQTTVCLPSDGTVVYWNMSGSVYMDSGCSSPHPILSVTPSYKGSVESGGFQFVLTICAIGALCRITVHTCGGHSATYGSDYSFYVVQGGSTSTYKPSYMSYPAGATNHRFSSPGGSSVDSEGWPHTAPMLSMLDIYVEYYYEADITVALPNCGACSDALESIGVGISGIYAGGTVGSSGEVFRYEYDSDGSGSEYCYWRKHVDLGWYSGGEGQCGGSPAGETFRFYTGTGIGDDFLVAASGTLTPGYGGLIGSAETACNLVQIVVNLNGGSMDTGESVSDSYHFYTVKNGYISHMKPTVSRTDCTFSGFSGAPSGSSQDSDGWPSQATEDMTLDCVWQCSSNA